MGDEIMELLGEEIKSQIESLSSLEAGSKEQSDAVDNLAKLYRLRIEENKNNWEYSEKFDRREMENEQHRIDVEMKQKQIEEEANAHEREEQFKRDQLSEQIKDRYFRFGMDIAGIILPLIFYASWMKKGFKFEETGTFTSTTFRGLFNRFRPTKK